MDELETVARGIYHAFARPMEGKAIWFDQLPLEAKFFLRDQARAGFRALRAPSDNMIAAAVAVCDLDAPEIEGIWDAMIGAVLKDGVQ